MDGAYVNATVLPMDRDDRTASAVAWQDRRIVAVGTDAAVRKEAQRRGLCVEDLDGRLVLPGFVDAHMHLLHVGIRRTRPDLSEAQDLTEALGLVEAWLKAHPGTDAVTGEAWDESEWPERRPPTRRELDGLTEDRPLVLRRVCGHVAVANSAALRQVLRLWDAPLVDAESGLLLEQPSLYLNEALPEPEARLDHALGLACQEALRIGVTTVGTYEQTPMRRALLRAQEKGRLPIRIVSHIYPQALEEEVAGGFCTGRPHPAGRILAAPGPEATAHDRSAPGSKQTAPGPQKAAPAQEGKAHPPGRSHEDRLRDGGLKVFLDGSIGGHSALLLEPYEDRPETKGLRNWSDDDLDRLVGRAHAAGVQVHAHAIGNGAVEQGLRAFERLMDQGGFDPEKAPHGGAAALHAAAPTPNPLRHRFEHFELVHDGQVRRAVALGLMACPQPNFVGEWSGKGGLYEQRLGARFRLNNRFADWRRLGLRMAFGSDGMPFGPLYGLQSALEHPDPRQRLDLRTAIGLYTREAAWSLHWDNVGSLVPGHHADLLVFDVRKGWEQVPPQEWVLERTLTAGQVQHEGMRAVAHV